MYYLLFTQDPGKAEKLFAAGTAWLGPVAFLCPTLLPEPNLCIVTESPVLQWLRGSKSTDSICILN